MKNFIEMLKSDPAFAKEFAEYLKGADAKAKEGCTYAAEYLNKLVYETISGFAAAKGIKLEDSAEVKKQLAILSKQICLQMDEMIVKQFKAMNLLKENGTTKK